MSANCHFTGVELTSPARVELVTHVTCAAQRSLEILVGDFPAACRRCQLQQSGKNDVEVQNKRTLQLTRPLMRRRHCVRKTDSELEKLAKVSGCFTAASLKLQTTLLLACPRTTVCSRVVVVCRRNPWLRNSYQLHDPQRVCCNLTEYIP